MNICYLNIKSIYLTAMTRSLVVSDLYNSLTLACFIEILSSFYFIFWFRVSYRDGAMEHEPKACAAVKGTQIMVPSGLLAEN